MATLNELKRVQKQMLRAEANAATAKAKHQQAVEILRATRETRLQLLTAYIDRGGASVFRDVADALAVSVPRVYQLYYGYTKSRSAS